ncbi:hypothetical protein WS68_08025 [Burkholderia sp. TSV86]|nr:hypothetical protein WS68_08025 [Burkholderia sp. TSV86]
MRTEHNVAQHGHTGQQIDVLEHTANTPMDDFTRTQPVAPFGPINPTICDARTSKLTSPTATSPPNCLYAPSTANNVSPGRGKPRFGSSGP